MIKSVVKFWGGALDNFGMPANYFSYWIVASPWDQAEDAGVATIVPLGGSTVASSINGAPIQSHYPVLSGGELAAYEKALTALKGVSVHAGLKFDEKKEIV